VTLGIESIEGKGESPCSRFSESLRHVLRDADAVGADDDPKSAL
jgi:hypothetical protein